ncbi:MAG: methylated-DNA--[protein]-cysteine S-methyltransferase [Intrasporangium sp.]|uniref:methylated-DNA--[protein]-cysteine S-methyltransferase n=1 Tax=Intrasporangium sp. TaxID=1925024 RepID=UPI002648A869|nr:methylated-DNA--[protein]-cysteine S-methyltransferase [Intrasporangium sp.]MDN5797364.1 methylated-DNA--[protein]-cysteine S-methyltransferase [Intrasporangium sp.]
MTPRHVVTDSPIGELTIVADGGAITRVHMDAEKYRPTDASLYGEAADAAEEPFASAIRQLDEYFRHDCRDFDLPLAPAGDEFAQRVWALLRAIPYGETTTYGALARTLGDRNLAQAVGHANGHNPISIIIPCHRVVGADGSLTGYAGGLHRKRFLLALEEPAADTAGRLF